MRNPFFLSRLIYVFLLLQFSKSVSAQDSTASWSDIKEIRLVKNISKKVSATYTGKKENWQDVFTKISFKPGILFNGSVPTGFVTKKILLKFNICNSADTTAGIFFFPGFYYTHIQLYKSENGRLDKIPDILPPVADSPGFRLIPLQAHDSATIIAELSFAKTYINSIRPRLVHPAYIASFMPEIRSRHNQDNVVTYIFCGLMLMMILFSLANFLQGGNKEFLYYSGFAFFLGTMLLTKAVFDYRITTISLLFETYLDFIFQGIGIIFYMLFMQKFLETKTRHPFLHQLYRSGIGLLLVSLTAYTVLHYFSDNFTLENNIENITKILLLVMILAFLVYSIRRWNDNLLRYLFWGNVMLFIFSLVSQMAVMLENKFLDLPGVFSSSLFYYEAGLFLELVMFLAGLNYKNRRNIIAQTREREMLKAENKMKEYEKELAVLKAQQTERERISSDMHDELGSGMTAIRLMSEIARNKMQGNVPVEIEKISSSANEVLDKMNVIIWSMNSGNDTVDSLVSYIRSWSIEYFENTPVLCKINTPDIKDNREINGDKRRNIFLCIKETMNNILKHSGAAEVSINIETNHHLTICVADNGRGINMEQLRQFGNGLKNMKRRMESIGGTFSIENNNGTVTTLVLPL
jgi:signal transduction histidine kinase